MLSVRVHEVPISHLTEYSRISSAFEIKSFLDIQPDPEEEQAWNIRESRLPRPILKDYDSLPENHPLDWAMHFDLSSWGMIFATVANEHVGAALIAFNTPGVDMLEDRSDLAVLWDIRVDTYWRGRAVGKALFDAVKEWASRHRCTELKIETQTNNVAAARFYLRQGCRLKQVTPNAYPELPEEVQLLFYLPLDTRDRDT
jgi:GNAT superfamily N-acetyltransferase